MSNVIGAFAMVKWTADPIGEEEILFLIGDTPQELDDNDKTIWERSGDDQSLEDITVVEVTHNQWWDIKHGTNIGLGYYIIDTESINTIKK